MQQVRRVAVFVQDRKSEAHLDMVASDGCRFHRAVVVPESVELRSFCLDL